MRLKIPLQFILCTNFLLFVMVSCKKKDATPPPCIAAKGGLSQVVIYANHGGTPMLNYISHPDTAFVKFNTLTSPGISPANYDTFYVSDWRMGDHIHCTNLKCGNYYFYRTAFDSLNNTRYAGGVGLTLEMGVSELDTTVIVN